MFSQGKVLGLCVTDKFYVDKIRVDIQLSFIYSFRRLS
jgi:hypothetical protein